LLALPFLLVGLVLVVRRVLVLMATGETGRRAESTRLLASGDPPPTGQRARRCGRTWVLDARAAGPIATGMTTTGTQVALPAGVTAEGDGMATGETGVRVDAYIDFLCPFCRQFEAASGDALKQMVAERLITLVYHPLGFLDRLSTTAYSSRASAASGCASDGGRLVAFKDALFAGRQVLDGRSRRAVDPSQTERRTPVASGRSGSRNAYPGGGRPARRVSARPELHGGQALKSQECLEPQQSPVIDGNPRR
jgi:hypothetical protein